MGEIYEILKGITTIGGLAGLILGAGYLIDRRKETVNVPSEVRISRYSCEYDRAGPPYGGMIVGRILIIGDEEGNLFATRGSMGENFVRVDGECEKLEKGEVGINDKAYIEGPGIRNKLFGDAIWVPDIKLENK